MGAAEEVQRERETRQGDADNISRPQRLAHVVARAVHDLGYPEGVHGEYQILQPPARMHTAQASSGKILSGAQSNCSRCSWENHKGMQPGSLGLVIIPASNKA